MTKKTRPILAYAVFLTMMCLCASASTDSTFTEITTKLSNWMTGSLGITFSLGALAVGLAMGVVKQSVMSVVTGVSIALASSLGPQVLSGIFSATL